MLFLVISTPRPESPSVMTERRKKAWPWFEELKAQKKVLSMHARVGRGGVAMLSVASNLELHTILNQWAELIPCTHDVYPLLDSEEAQTYLTQHQPL